MAVQEKADDLGTGVSSHVKFDTLTGGIQPKTSASAEDRIAENDASHCAIPFNTDDIEKARQIAAEDSRRPPKQKYSGFVLLWLSWQATGVIYGDIGTSPLYVFSSTFTSHPSWSDLVGALSIIIWSLTLIVTIKYTLIVLRADDDGQGGSFALYSLLSRYINIADGDPNEKGVCMERYRTGDLRPENRSIRRFLENSTVSKVFLKVVGVVGAAMVMADGILTPAQSVLGAIQGIRVVKPGLGTPAIVGISCAIIVLLFFSQPLGTAKIGTAFAPTVVVWLLFNMCSGIYNLAKHDYTVLKAFSPYFAFSYLARNGHDGWKSLSGLLLAFTGVEALFADLGAFGKRAVQLSWLLLAYPCLLLAYIGEAAYISQDSSGTAYTNPFFNSVPPGTFYFALVIAVLAAIVASQALITSAFQLLSQVMRMSYFPHIKVVHTSQRFHDQVYLPLANWLLMTGTIIVIAVYNNTTSLGNAYGVCVIILTFITTQMVALVAILVWRVPLLIVTPIWLMFASLDGTYLTAVLTKIPDGAWLTIVLAAVLSFVFILWRFGKEAQWAAESADRIPPSALLVRCDAGMAAESSAPAALSLLESPAAAQAAPLNSPRPTGIRLTPAFGGTPVSAVPGLGIFFDKAGDINVLPPSFVHFVGKFAARPAVAVFFHMRPRPVASVPARERYVVIRTPGLDSTYSVVLRHGYADNVLRPGMARDLVAQIELCVADTIRGRAAGRQDHHVDAELEALRRALEAQVVYVLGKEAIRIKGRGYQPVALIRRVLLWIFLWIRENSRTKLADLDIDVDKMVEVGFLKEI